MDMYPKLPRLHFSMVAASISASISIATIAIVTTMSTFAFATASPPQRLRYLSFATVTYATASHTCEHRTRYSVRHGTVGEVLGSEPIFNSSTAF